MVPGNTSQLRSPPGRALDCERGGKKMAVPVKVLEPTKKATAPAPLRLVPPNEIFDRVEKLYDQIARRAFEIFDCNGRIFGRDLEDWFKAESALLPPTHLDVTDTEK